MDTPRTDGAKLTIACQDSFAEVGIYDADNKEYSGGICKAGEMGKIEMELAEARDNDAYFCGVHAERARCIKAIRKQCEKCELGIGHAHCRICTLSKIITVIKSGKQINIAANGIEHVAKGATQPNGNRAVVVVDRWVKSIDIPPPDHFPIMIVSGGHVVDVVVDVTTDSNGKRWVQDVLGNMPGQEFSAEAIPYWSPKPSMPTVEAAPAAGR